MGYYINQDSKGRPLPAHGKDQALINDGAIIVPTPKEFIPNLVCVVDNGMFQAAGFCYSPQELAHFKHPDGRPKVWLTYQHAAKLSGYSGE